LRGGERKRNQEEVKNRGKGEGSGRHLLAFEAMVPLGKTSNVVNKVQKYDYAG